MLALTALDALILLRGLTTAKAVLGTLSRAVHLDTQDAAHLVFVIRLQIVNAEPGELGALALEDLEAELEHVQVDHHALHHKQKRVPHGFAH